jgi:hypothetical protein
LNTKLGLVLPIKKQQNFQTSDNFTDFSNSVPIKNSKEKCAEILPASSTKKLVRKVF